MLEQRQLGNYRLLRRIGSGGMGEVYMAEDIRIARHVAIKVIRIETEPYPDPAALQDSQKLFLREMRAIAKLDHPHILPLFDFGEEPMEGQILTYMVMPLRSEGSLAEWLQRRGERLTFPEVAYFLGQAAEALQHAHDRALIHQDVKPANFLVRDREGNALPDILLSDFGIARTMSATSTASQTVRGTPAYMAPEQWEGAPVPASDQYALGIMAYVLLTGQPPFSGRMEQVMRQHLMVQPQPPSAQNPAIPPDLDKVVLIALAKQPGERFGSVMAFARAFQQATQPVSGSPSSPGLIAPPVEAAHEPQPDPVMPSVLPKSAPLPPTVDADTPPEPASSAPTRYASEERPVVEPVMSHTPPMLEPHILLGQMTPARQPAPTRGLGRPLAVIGVVVLLIISTVIGVNTYQSHVASVNATATADTQAQIDAENAQSTVDAQSTADAQATIDADNAQATTQAQAQATAQTLADNPYPSYMSGNGTLVVLDPLNSPGSLSTNDGCDYENDGFHVSDNNAHQFSPCSTTAQFSNFALEVRIEILSGDCADITIRGDTTDNAFYFFRVCTNGTYAIKKYTDASHAQAVTPAFGNSSAINTGVNANNTVGILADGSSMILFINQQQVDSIDDSTYSDGYISLCAEDITNATEVRYSNLRIWD